MSTSKNKLSVQTLVRCAMIAAVYTVLCLVLQPFSYGAVQVRVAEAFCLLPVFGAEYIVGVTLGCLLANLLGSTMVDVVFGTVRHPDCLPCHLCPAQCALERAGNSGVFPSCYRQCTDRWRV